MLTLDSKKKNAVISFSGGETSAFMLHWLLNNKADKYNFVVLFANTGWENEETLEFVDRCAKGWGVKVHWIEAVVNFSGFGSGFGTGYKLVDFASASRNQEPFRDVIAKYGIPNVRVPHCTRELKTAPLTKFALDYFDCSEFEVFIGIRADEFDRAKDKPRIAYPLLKLGIQKHDINRFWDSYKFHGLHLDWRVDPRIANPHRLQLPGWKGNCKGCFKKTYTKLLAIASESPEAFDFPLEMERQHEWDTDEIRKAKYAKGCGLSKRKKRSAVDKYASQMELLEVQSTIEAIAPVRFYRDHLSAQHFIGFYDSGVKVSYANDAEWSHQSSMLDEGLSFLDSGCNESCEAF